MAAVAALAVLAAAGSVAGGCGTAGPPGTASGARGSGPVDVLYAGSLVTLVQATLGPAFRSATGYSLTGIPAGSSALAGEIKGGVRRADVFISASPTVNASLEGPANGSWVRWYASFATSPLLLGYNPKSSFAAALRTGPWYRVVTQPGFRLGRTNPVTDPKGALAVEALDGTAKKQHDPALAALAATPSNVFPEQTMVGRLQAGQLDAGFFYAVEASAAGIPTVPLAGVTAAATYTVTVLDRAPHPAAADAFVSFLLGPRGRKLLEANGLVPASPPVLSGRRSAVPASLRNAVS